MPEPHLSRSDLPDEVPCAVAPSAEGLCIFPGLDPESSAWVDRALNRELEEREDA